MPLQSIGLMGCRGITDTGLGHLQHLPLQQLSLDFCSHITSIGRAQLQQPNLEYVFTIQGDGRDSLLT
jgi:hypothetical protein